MILLIEKEYGLKQVNYGTSGGMDTLRPGIQVRILSGLPLNKQKQQYQPVT